MGFVPLLRHSKMKASKTMGGTARFFGLLTVMAAVESCDDAHVHISSCTSFQNDGTTAQGGGNTAQDCNGTVIVVVHSALSAENSSSYVTFVRLELVSLGRVYVFFEGARRENLFDHRETAFILGQREDVPEVEFDLIRLKLGGERERIIEVPLDPPLGVAVTFPRRLRLDIDLEETPVVRAYGGSDPVPTVSLSPIFGEVLRVDPALWRFLFRAEDGSGDYWVSFDPAKEAFEPGARLLLEASVGENAEIW